MNKIEFKLVFNEEQGKLFNKILKNYSARYKNISYEEVLLRILLLNPSLAKPQAIFEALKEKEDKDVLLEKQIYLFFNKNKYKQVTFISLANFLNITKHTVYNKRWKFHSLVKELMKEHNLTYDISFDLIPFEKELNKLKKVFSNSEFCEHFNISSPTFHNKKWKLYTVIRELIEQNNIKYGGNKDEKSK